MILAIDVGNTNIVVGCIDDLKTYFIERLSTNRTKTELEYAVDLKNVLDIYHIKKTEIEGCIISSVVPAARYLHSSLLSALLPSSGSAHKPLLFPVL